MKYMNISTLLLLLQLRGYLNDLDFYQLNLYNLTKQETTSNKDPTAKVC